jgi:AcrR family transcriptional regulator
VVERGLDHLTVEAIADAAGVSRRTFSNYFIGKEEALLYGDQVRMRRLLDLVGDGVEGEDLWTTLTRAAEELATDSDVDPNWANEVRLLRLHPSLLGAQVMAYAKTERALAETIALRLPPDARARAQLLAAVYLTTLRVATQHWFDRPEVPLPDVFRTSLSQVSGVFESDPYAAGVVSRPQP